MSDDDAKSGNDAKRICYLKVKFPDELRQEVLMVQIWYNDEDHKDKIVAKLREHFENEIKGTVCELMGEDEGRRMSGRIVMGSHPAWELFVSRGLLVPIHFQTGCQN